MEVSTATCGWCGGFLKRDGDGPWWCFTERCFERQREWAVQAQEQDSRGRPTGRNTWLYVPTPAQTNFHNVRRPGATVGPRINRMYGGAAGPGKSHAERWDQYRKALTIPNFTGVILRRTMPELKKTHLRAFQRDASKLGANFLKSESQLVFDNGSILECGHCEDDDAVQKWLSTEYDQIGIDEGSTFEPDMLLEISTRARSSNPLVKAAGGAWFDVVTNPGGRSWALLRDLFVTQTPDFDIYPQLRTRYDPANWVYIKALLDGNPYLDASYAEDLAVLSDARYRQLRYGEEFVTEGAFFSQWREMKDQQPWHVQGYEVPQGSEWFCSLDWGWNSPGVILWWAVLPDGHYHIADEWKFQGVTADEAATEIKRKNEALGIKQLRYIVCDPAMKGKTGAGKGESIFETLIRRGLPMRAGDNDRFNGWQRCQALLRESPNGRPWLTVDERCRYGRRTIPAQVQDKHDPDDVDTNKDDHWVDAFRYGAMSRPVPVRRRHEPEREFAPGTWGFARRQLERSERRPGVL